MADDVAASARRYGNQNVWVIVPAFNEGDRLAGTLRSLCGRYPNVVVIDDGSTDATARIARQVPQVWLLRHVINCGQGAALQTGIDFALLDGAELLVTFDADGQHSVEDIARLLEPVRAGRADVVLGSRFLGTVVGMPWSRWLTLKLGVVFTRVFSQIRVTDAHNGLRVLSRHAAQRIHITLDGMAHASQILDQVQRHGLRYCELPVTIRYNKSTLEKGQSSWNSFRIVGQLVLGRFVR